MASLFRSTQSTVKYLGRILSPFLKTSNTGSNIGQIRSAVTSETGAILAEPKKVPFGIPRIIFTILPGLYLGATLSKEGAAFLEENDIFVPDEDDDDD